LLGDADHDPEQDRPAKRQKRNLQQGDVNGQDSSAKSTARRKLKKTKSLPIESSNTNEVDRISALSRANKKHHEELPVAAVQPTGTNKKDLVKKRKRKQVSVPPNINDSVVPVVEIATTRNNQRPKLRSSALPANEAESEQKPETRVKPISSSKYTYQKVKSKNLPDPAVSSNTDSDDVRPLGSAQKVNSKTKRTSPMLRIVKAKQSSMPNGSASKLAKSNPSANLVPAALKNMSDPNLSSSSDLESDDVRPLGSAQKAKSKSKRTSRMPLVVNSQQPRLPSSSLTKLTKSVPFSNANSTASNSSQASKVPSDKEKVESTKEEVLSISSESSSSASPNKAGFLLSKASDQPQPKNSQLAASKGAAEIEDEEYDELASTQDAQRDLEKQRKSNRDANVENLETSSEPELPAPKKKTVSSQFLAKPVVNTVPSIADIPVLTTDQSYPDIVTTSSSKVLASTPTLLTAIQAFLSTASKQTQTEPVERTALEAGTSTDDLLRLTNSTTQTPSQSQSTHSSAGLPVNAPIDNPNDLSSILTQPQNQQEISRLLGIYNQMAVLALQANTIALESNSLALQANSIRAKLFGTPFAPVSSLSSTSKSGQIIPAPQQYPKSQDTLPARSNDQASNNFSMDIDEDLSQITKDDQAAVDIVAPSASAQMSESTIDRLSQAKQSSSSDDESSDANESDILKNPLNFGQKVKAKARSSLPTLAEMRHQQTSKPAVATAKVAPEGTDRDVLVRAILKNRTPITLKDLPTGDSSSSPSASEEEDEELDGLPAPDLETRSRTPSPKPKRRSLPTRLRLPNSDEESVPTSEGEADSLLPRNQATALKPNGLTRNTLPEGTTNGDLRAAETKEEAIESHFRDDSLVVNIMQPESRKSRSVLCRSSKLTLDLSCWLHAIDIVQSTY